MVALTRWLREHRLPLMAWLAVMAAVGTIEWSLGRSLLGPDGRFGFWDGDIWSRENSQRVADAYTFSHFIHGILFFASLRLLMPRMPVHYRFILAVALEGGWELLENSPFIINRYREATIALGYVGDSVLNSVSDIVFAGLGFLFAHSVRPRVSLILVIVLELGCLFWVRDNLTLNIVMLVHPVQAIKTWQSEGRH